MNKEDAICEAENTYDAVTAIVISPSAPTSQINLNLLQHDERSIREFLTSHKWPVGLQDAFIRGCASSAFRYFICDDSGSMSIGDGHTIYDIGNTKRYV